MTLSGVTITRLVLFLILAIGSTATTCFLTSGIVLAPCTVWFRYGLAPDAHDGCIGFRLVLAPG
jgi:hypothetical protein